MSKIKNFIILIAIIIYAQLIRSDEDLIELNCADEMQCKQFEGPGIKSSCLQEQCRCTASSGKSVKCQPVNPKVNNVIGGSCPCTIPNAECDKEQNICYCQNECVPSGDRRRCIPKTVALNQTCEESSQCQRTDFNAFCHDSKKCKCMSEFVSDEGVCVSVLGNKSRALNDTKCHGANTRYSPSNQQCICVRGYFASVDNAKCLKVSKYLENCTENLQCMGAMGLGAVCASNVCACAEKYFVAETKGDDGVVRGVCTPVVERGQYCRYDQDCHQHQFSVADQSLHCKYGECDCKDGYNSFNGGACIAGSGAGKKSLMNLHLSFILFAGFLFVIF